MGDSVAVALGVDEPPPALSSTSSIDEALAARLRGCAGLCNVIAQGYLRIDVAHVPAALAERDDLRRFVACVSARLCG